MRSQKNAVHSDSGLNAYMARIYRYMALGLGVTAAVAYLPQMLGLQAQHTFYSLSSVSWVGTLGIAIYFGAALQRMKSETARMLFWVYSALMGVSLSTLFGVYQSHSIARAFFVTSCTFGVMSAYGSMTKKDLSGLGSFAMMGLWGLIIASLVNIFLRSTGMDFVLSVAGVIIFTSLIAYDTQRLQSLYYSMPHHKETRSKMAILGALMLYMDVVNLFVSLVRLTGDRK
jgi:hypothetical protein